MTNPYALQLEKIENADALLELTGRVRRDRKLTLLERAELLARFEEKSRELVLAKGRRRNA